ncbi:hydrogenase expression/formation protein HypE [Ponticaulis sp.]|uniref:hydrogenase expression/formation protein HypE n=1 Tax=Ponticaulis sp. TaxID=2020902 RepID=UPI000C636159|nr:hydrogenase expression/formation protein HypE [Ponticaulis sp.]MAF59090.1 hydrogenase expression/formation protein HypE [Ponticaulis sp.]MBN03050.1 hydrogenase expression/formation protein HypE [Ponticaulis sp.]
MKTKRPKLDLKNGRVELTYGGGGRAMSQLIDELFRPAFSNTLLDELADYAGFPGGKRMVMATDGHVISPLFFPGGDIGCLSVHGTVNDVAMSGAKPLYLSASFILEEGFPLGDLHRIVTSMAEAAKAAGVSIVTGDTKVVERGKGDGVFITTTGIGVVEHDTPLGAGEIRSGDKIIVSGTIGDHGVAVMSKREGLSFGTDIQSDTAALHELTALAIETAPGLRVMRDPTRGGVAATLNELAEASGLGVRLDEASLPIRPEVNGACELLGLDPLNVANEGKLIAICSAEDADKLLATMRAHPLGKNAAMIGEMADDPHHFVQMTTSLGGNRIVDWLSGEQLPRIC